MGLNRRDFLRALGAAAAGGALHGCAGVGAKGSGNVVVIGAGYGGTTAAKYIRMWSGGGVNVTLIERNPSFISCPLSNLVLGGTMAMDDITLKYDSIQKHGVKLVQDEVTAIDADKRVIRLARGGELAYDRLVVATGIDFLYESIPALGSAAAQEKILHSWKAGPQTVALRKQLEAMKDGGVYALSVPKAPYRCPPGPYERACMVAYYFKTEKPKSKVLILDANEDVVSKKGLFMKAWGETYKGIIEYRPNSELRDVDVANTTAILEFDKVKADVLNVVPPQRAGSVAKQAGLITANERWCGIDWLSMESIARKNIHVIGDATLAAPLMPKSGHMANQHAKLAAAAIVNLLSGLPPNPEPLVMNTCYSWIDAKTVAHVASVHRYDAGQKTLVTVPGSGGLSTAPNDIEAKAALAWAKNTWADMMG
jgi:sulfite dehydrogenase